MTTAAVIYARLSASYEGATSTTRQVRECQRYADQEGLAVVDVFVDEGRSGYRRGVARPAFDQALAALTEGRATTLLVWKLDRLSRRGIGQVGEVLDRLEASGGRIVSVKDGADSATPTGRMVYALLSEVARQEAANTGTRVAAKKAEMVEDGLWPGGLPPFGHRLVVTAKSPRMVHDRFTVDPAGPVGRLVIDPREAALLRDVAALVTDGGSIRDAVALLNASDVRPFSGGAHWAKSSVARLLRSPILCGWLPAAGTGKDRNRLRDRGEPSRDSQGRPVVVVAGESVLTVAERQRLMAVLSSRSVATGTKRQGRNQGGALLTGLLICGGCGGRLGIDRASGMYRCHRRGRLGCTGSGVGIDVAEETVVGRALRRLGTLEPHDPRTLAVAERWLARTSPEQEVERDRLAAALSEVQARSADLADAHFLRGTVDAENYDRLAKVLSEEAAALAGRLSDLPPVELDLGPLLDLVATAEAGPLEEGSAWAALAPHLQREVLRCLIDHVQVLGRDEAERLSVSWAGRS